MSADPGQATRLVRRKARAEAAVWVVRLHGPDRTPALEAAFRRWLAAHEENARQFERVTEIWDESPALPSYGTARLVQFQQRAWSGAWLRAAVVLLVCGLLTYMAIQAWVPETYRTRVGEQRIVRLEDGSRVSLNSKSVMTVKYTLRRRHVVLERGEAYFEVVHDAQRAFTVSADGNDVTALGTTFLVRHDDKDRTSVTLVEGKVSVGTQAAAIRSDARARAAHDSGRRESLLTLEPGQRVVLTRDAAPRVDSPQIDALLAWRRGEVVLDNTSLSDAITEMNRYETKPLRVDWALGEHLRISGIYRIGDSRGFAQTVSELYHLQIIENEHEIRFVAGPHDTSSAR